MGTKNFVSNGDAETLFTDIGNKLSTLKSGLTNLVKIYHATATTDEYGDFAFGIPGDGVLVNVRPLRNDEYYNGFWCIQMASQYNNTGYGCKAVKDDGTVLASQAVKFDVYYI